MKYNVIIHQVKAVPEVCRIFCATANPLQVIVGRSDHSCDNAIIPDISRP
ncbi:MAG: adenosine-specific kinase [Candidatus Aegiribacteria sp.]|nr:adenosine-specific kinase [Candidatus Aegiribacteria sp.]